MLTLLLVSSCRKVEEPEWHPEEFCHDGFTENWFPLPPATGYDLNDDGINDIEIFHEVVRVSTSESDSRILSQLSPLDVNQVLSLVRASYIKAGTEIELDDPNWRGLKRSLMSVGGCGGLYKGLWTPLLGNNESAYAAVKIFQKGNVYLAWVEVKRNFRTGEAEIADYGYINGKNIIAGEH